MRLQDWLILLVLIVVAPAAKATVLMKRTTGDVQGFSNILGTEASTCTYSVEKRKSMRGADELVVTLKSDKETGIQDMLRIEVSKLPLKEGVLVARPGMSITYKKGVLTKKERLPSEGPSGQDHQVLMLKVSPDLQSIKLAYALDSVKSAFSEKPLAEINCKF